MGLHWKIQLLVGGSQKANIEEGGCLKRGAWTVCQFKGGWQEREGGVLEWGIPQCTLPVIPKSFDTCLNATLCYCFKLMC